MKLGWVLIACYFVANLLVTHFGPSGLRVEGLQIFRPTTEMDLLREIFSIVPIVAAQYDFGYGYTTAMVFGDVIGCYAAMFFFVAFALVLLVRPFRSGVSADSGLTELPSQRHARQAITKLGVVILALSVFLAAAILVLGATIGLNATGFEMRTALSSPFSGFLYVTNICLSSALAMFLLAIEFLRIGAPRRPARTDSESKSVVRRSPHSR